MAHVGGSVTPHTHVHTRGVKRAIRSVGVLSAIVYGAVLMGAVALIAGIIALILASTTTNDGGPFRGFVHAILFVGIGLVPLIAPVLLGLFAGALGGGVLALVYNVVAKLTGGIEVEVEDV